MKCVNSCVLLRSNWPSKPMKMTFLLFCVIILNDTRFFSTSFAVHCCLIWCVGVPQSFFTVHNECDCYNRQSEYIFLLYVIFKQSIDYFLCGIVSGNTYTHITPSCHLLGEKYFIILLVPNVSNNRTIFNPNNDS